MNRYIKVLNEEGTFTEKKVYLDEDMDSFAEWCSVNGWNVSIKKHRWVNDNGEGINTSKLREIWEKERKEVAK